MQGLGDPNGGGAKVGQHQWGGRSGWVTPVRVAEMLGSAGEGGAKVGRGRKKHWRVVEKPTKG